MRKAHLPILLASFLMSACGSLGTKTVTYRDELVSVGEIHSPLSYFFAHLDTPRFLVIRGKRYTNVQGGNPCYLKIPELNSILLVTEGRRDHYTYHIISLANFQDIRIDGGDYSFGIHIGAGINSAYADYIEKVDGNKVFVAKRRETYKELLTLDLGLKKVVCLESFQYDKDGKLIGHEVDPEFEPSKR